MKPPNKPLEPTQVALPVSSFISWRAAQAQRLGDLHVSTTYGTNFRFLCP
jgi:hypothetical protein